MQSRVPCQTPLKGSAPYVKGATTFSITTLTIIQSAYWAYLRHSALMIFSIMGKVQSVVMPSVIILSVVVLNVVVLNIVVLNVLMLSVVAPLPSPHKQTMANMTYLANTLAYYSKMEFEQYKVLQSLVQAKTKEYHMGAFLVPVLYYQFSRYCRQVRF